MLAFSTLSAQASVNAKEIGKKEKADLVGTDGKKIGTVTVTQADTGVMIFFDIKANSVLQEGKHGAHIHKVGDVSDYSGGFKKSGGHISSDAKQVHGFMNKGGNIHEADLPNLYITKDGSLKVEIFRPGVSLKEAKGFVPLLDDDGSAIVIHINSDDYKSQPIGGAGTRLAGAAFN